MIKENQKHLNRVLVLCDTFSIVVALLLAWWIRFRSELILVESGYLSLREYFIPVLVVIPIYITIYNIFKLYTPYRFKNSLEEIFNVIKSNILGLLILVLILYLFKEIDYSRYLLFFFGILSVLITVIERIGIRLILRQIRKKGYNLKHILIVGYSDLAVELIRRIDRNKHWGYNVAGILDDHKKLGYQIKNKHVLGTIEELERHLNEIDIDEVFITLQLKEYEKLQKIISISEKTGVKTQIIPDYYRYIPAKPYVEEIDGLPIIHIRHIPLDNIVNRSIKRLIDVLGALTALLVFFPIMVFVAVTIKITSPGPILFKQERIGLNRKNFNMYKFRSMHVQKEEEERSQWTTKDDPRKTKFGNFIRKTSLDELPQILNVLKGDMSLIGPRPERPYFVEKFKEEIPKYMIKHQVRPGITGWAQVNGWRGDTSIKKRIEYDLYYIENWNIGIDIKILFLTIFKGFINRNAY